jgi:uncharacterized membrane protein
VTFIKIRSHRRKFSNSDSVEQKNVLLVSPYPLIILISNFFILWCNYDNVMAHLVERLLDRSVHNEFLNQRHGTFFFIVAIIDCIFFALTVLIQFNPLSTRKIRFGMFCSSVTNITQLMIIDKY